MTTAPLAGLGERMKTGRILHREYFIDLERNAYSWRIVAITHPLRKSFLPAPTFFYPNQATAEQCARKAIDSYLNRGCVEGRQCASSGSLLASGRRHKAPVGWAGKWP
jgi:hypothetical protein